MSTTQPEGILLSNGTTLRYVADSAAVGFFGTGWWFQKPFAWFGQFDLREFTVVGKSLTRNPRSFSLANFPWIRFLDGGMVNKWSLANMGVDAFVRRAPKRFDHNVQFIASLAPTPGIEDIDKQILQILESVRLINPLPIKGVVINMSCPNTDGCLPTIPVIIAFVTAVLAISKHPVIVKLSATQEYEEIVRELARVKSDSGKRVEAIMLNCVPVSVRYPGRRFFWSKSGGGVSGKPAQAQNWEAARRLLKQGLIPVVVPSVMTYKDAQLLIWSGANAISMTALFWTKPWMPTRIVRQLMQVA